MSIGSTLLVRCPNASGPVPDEASKETLRSNFPCGRTEHFPTPTCCPVQIRLYRLPRSAHGASDTPPHASAFLPHLSYYTDHKTEVKDRFRPDHDPSARKYDIRLNGYRFDAGSFSQFKHQQITASCDNSLVA